MQKTLKLTLITLVVLSFQGCASHSNFVKKYDSWVGQNITSFIKQIGYPDSTFILPNKHKVYVYAHSRVYSLPSPMIRYNYNGYYGGYGMFGFGFGYENDMVQETCKLFIETNKKGVISKWGSRGNHCVSQ